MLFRKTVNTGVTEPSSIMCSPTSLKSMTEDDESECAEVEG